MEKQGHVFGQNGPEGKIKAGMESDKPPKEPEKFDGIKKFSAKRKRDLLSGIASARMDSGVPMMGGGGPMGPGMEGGM